MIEFMLDTANINAINRLIDMYPIAGVTSNPTILKSEGKIDFFPHMKKIREIIGTYCDINKVAISSEELLVPALKVIPEEKEEDEFWRNQYFTEEETGENQLCCYQSSVPINPEKQNSRVEEDPKMDHGETKTEESSEE
jgi:hypothetical protein